jgi:hypothetical protein
MGRADGPAPGSGGPEGAGRPRSLRAWFAPSPRVLRRDPLPRGEREGADRPLPTGHCGAKPARGGDREAHPLPSGERVAAEHAG